MIKKYLSSSVIIASLMLLFTACDNTGATLTEIWRAKGPVNEYISETYAFDSKSSMIVQGMKFDADGNEIDSLFKINSSGQTQWSVSSTWGDVKIDNNDNVYSFYCTYSSASGSGLLFSIVKYSPAGAILWQKQDIETSYSISIDYGSINNLIHALDSAGNLFILGKAGDQYTIVKINPDGNEIWRQNFATHASRLITDSLGNAYIGCANYVTANKTYDIRVLKYSAAGSLQWSRACISGATDYEVQSYALLTDNMNNLLIVRNDRAAYVNKFDAAGSQLWEYAYTPSDAGSSKNVEAIVKCDSSGNIIISAVVSVLTGLIYGTDGSFPLPTGYDYCQLIKVDTNGKKSWSKKVSTVMIYNGDMGGQLSVDSSGNIYVFCLDNLLVKYNASGKKLWSYTPEITDVSMGQISEWHVGSDGYLYWILQCGAAEMTDGYWITKYSQQ